MKALILILVAAACAAAQQLPTVADVARQERARRAQSRSSRTYTTEDIRTTPPAEMPEPTSAPNATPSEAAPKADAAAGTAAAAAEPTQEQDPVQQWLLENEARREELRRLRDQELEAQLQVNDATNQLNAPISTQSAKDDAAANLQAAQLNLKGIRERIAKSQSELEARELQGPPKK